MYCKGSIVKAVNFTNILVTWSVSATSSFLVSISSSFWTLGVKSELKTAYIYTTTKPTCSATASAASSSRVDPTFRLFVTANFTCRQFYAVSQISKISPQSPIVPWWRRPVSWFSPNTSALVPSLQTRPQTLAPSHSSSCPQCGRRSTWPSWTPWGLLANKKNKTKNG